MLTCVSFWEIGHEIGLHQSIVSRIFNRYVKILLQHYSGKLTDNLNYFNNRLAVYNSKLRHKIESLGDEVQNYLMNISCFTDGTIHCVVFQVTTGIDGIIMDMYGGFPGSRHDSHIYTSSCLTDDLLKFSKLTIFNTKLMQIKDIIMMRIQSLRIT